MARKAHLSSVPPGSTAPRRPAAPRTVRAAADVSERALLVALRNKIARDIDKGVPAHALAPLARQLRDLDREVRALDAADKGDEIGDAIDTPDEAFAP